MRTVKAPEVRRQELMDAAETLFSERGIDDTTVSDIIERAGVAKGTFYWHFRSKEELLDALVERANDRYIERVTPIVEADGVGALAKLAAAAAMHVEAHGAGGGIHGYLHREENALAHQKHLAREMAMLAPLLARAVEQGVAEGVFDTRYPVEATEFMLAAVAFALDPATLRRGPASAAARLAALAVIMERALGAEPGALRFIAELARFESPGPDARAQ
jgi:AcrR family transcriptional regulator